MYSIRVFAPYISKMHVNIILSSIPRVHVSALFLIYAVKILTVFWPHVMGKKETNKYEM
jgi:hypothetical protein